MDTPELRHLVTNTINKVRDGSEVEEELLRFASLLGIENRVIEPLVDYSLRRRYDLVVADDISTTISDAHDAHFLIPVIQGVQGIAPFFYAILAASLQAHGCDITIVRCHSDLDLCLYKENDDLDPTRCKYCTRHGNEILDRFGLDYTSLGSLLPADYEPLEMVDTDVSADVPHKDVNISEYARSSTRRVLKKYHLENGPSRDQRIYTGMLTTGAMVADVAHELFSDDTYDAVLTHDPAYVYGGIFLDVAKKQGVNPITFGKGYRDGTMIFGGRNDSSYLPQFSDSDVVESYLETPLTDTEKDEIRRIMAGRSDGSTSAVDYTSLSENKGIEETHRPTIGMFTNLIWDASLSAAGELFVDPFDWIGSTIEYVRDQTDYRLTIKTHPAEELMGTNESVGGWI
jgi:hypothetical protein